MKCERLVCSEGVAQLRVRRGCPLNVRIELDGAVFRNKEGNSWRGWKCRRRCNVSMKLTFTEIRVTWGEGFRFIAIENIFRKYCQLGKETVLNIVVGQSRELSGLKGLLCEGWSLNLLSLVRDLTEMICHHVPFAIFPLLLLMTRRTI